MTENLEGTTSIVEGELFTLILNYENYLGAKVKLIYDLDNVVKYPELEIIDKASAIGKDFQTGVPIQKVIKWMEKIYHPN